MKTLSVFPVLFIVLLGTGIQNAAQAPQPAQSAPATVVKISENLTINFEGDFSAPICKKFYDLTLKEIRTRSTDSVGAIFIAFESRTFASKKQYFKLNIRAEKKVLTNGRLVDDKIAYMNGALIPYDSSENFAKEADKVQTESMIKMIDGIVTAMKSLEGQNGK